MEKITTISTSYYSQKVLEPIVIEETSTTRKIFVADLNDRNLASGETVSGTIIHQRKGVKQAWDDISAIDLTTLKGGEGVKLHLSSRQVKNLFEALQKLYKLAENGVTFGQQEYIVAPAEEIVEVPRERKAAITSLINQNFEEDVWNELISSNPDLATKLSLARIHSNRTFCLKEFEDNLNSNHTEKYWQDFFYNNQWIFGYGLDYKFLTIATDQPTYGGVNYMGKGAQRGDFLTHGSTGVNFTVLVEIKRPDSPLLGRNNKNGDAIRYRNGAWLLSSELLGGVLQLQTNCKTWQRTADYPENKSLIDGGTFTVSPKGIIIIGNLNNLFDREQIESFEGFRRGLANIEIITFDELYERAKHILSTETVDGLPSNISNDDDSLPF